MTLETILLVLLSIGKIHPQIVVVMEYKPTTDSHLSPGEILMKNSEEYIKILKNVSKTHNVSVIVFPEATLDNVRNSKDLSSYVTPINPGDNPCNLNSYPSYMKKLSCAAKQYHTAMVINLIEKLDNKYCTSDVVLNQEGLIEYSVKRERRVGVPVLKNRPIAFAIPGRFSFNIDKNDEFSFISTSFVTGFSFSHEKIFSFDEEYIFYLVSSNWISELPFLTSLQVLQMWTEEFGRTVFMSGANNPESGQGGTAIYDGEDGPLVMDISSDGSTKVYIYNFLKKEVLSSVKNKTDDELAKEMDQFNLAVDPDLFRYESMVVDHDQTQIDKILCYNKTLNNSFCCEFNLGLSFNSSLKKKNYYTYHLVAYKGYKTYHDIFEPGGIEVCAVIACLDSNLTSCGRRFKKYEEVYWPLTFRELIVKATFGELQKEKNYWSIQFPNSLLSSIRPIHPSLTNWTEETLTDEYDSSVRYLQRTFALREPLSKILTFGIFGRNFTLVDPRHSSTRLNMISLFVVLSGLIIVFI